MKKTIIIVLLTLLSIATQAQDSLKICSIGFVTEDTVEVVFVKPTDSLIISQVDNYQLFLKNDPQSVWSYRKTINKNDLSVFYDTISNSNDSNYYKIFAFDSLGNVVNTSQVASYIHFYTIVDTNNFLIEFFICPPTGIHCNQYITLKDSAGIIDTVGMTANSTCFSYIQSFPNGINANFYTVGGLTNSCYPSFKLNSGTSIGSNIQHISLSSPQIIPNLIAYYPLNGDANDAIGTNDGILNGCTWTTDSAGNSNSALHFNGINDWVQFASSPVINNQSFTISAWIKLDSQKDNNPIVSFGYNGTLNSKEVSLGTYEFNNSSKSVLYTGNYYTSSNNQKRIEQNPAYPNHVLNSNWYFITMVYDNINSPWNNTSNFGSLDDSYKFYINGIKSTSPSTWNNNGSFNSAFPLNNSMSFGVSKGEGNTQYLSGSIDEVKIYLGALDSLTVLANYFNSYTGINEETLNDNIIIYPNPSNNHQITIDNLLSDSEISLFNCQGQNVYRCKTFDNKIIINNLKSGLYIVKIIKDNIIKTKKVEIF